MYGVASLPLSALGAREDEKVVFNEDGYLDMLRGEGVIVFGQHDAAKALREINKTVGKWSEGTRGLKVYARDGDARDQRTREFRDAQLAERRAREATQDGPNAQPDDEHEG